MKLSIAAGLVMLIATVTGGPIAGNDNDGTIAPLFVSPEAESVADSYIVVFKNHLNDNHMEEHTNWIQTVASSGSANSGFDAWLKPDTLGISHVYKLPSLKGYAGKFGKDVLEMIRRSDDVAFVEKDSIVYTNEMQRNAPWGLARISHKDRLSFRTFNKYEYDQEGGKDIKVYVIDTGINVEHVDFEGRARWGKTIPKGDEDEDGNGHGSHCAGTIAGGRFGVAKMASPVAVKVLRSNGSGTMSDVVSGVDWATEQHIKEAEAAKKEGKVYKGSVANMSLGGGKSPSLDMAVNGAVDAGIVFAVAAGNDNRDACDYSPAAAENAITVGASTLYDDRAYFSNYGPCVDVFAPGLNIQSVWRGSKYATNTISGTSMASPHVAGLSAYFLGLTEKGASPKEIKDMIIDMSIKGKLEKIPNDTPNKLIYNGAEDKKD